MQVWRVIYNIIGTKKIMEFIVFHKSAVRAMFIADIASIRKARKIMGVRMVGTKTLSCKLETYYKHRR